MMRPDSPLLTDLYQLTMMQAYLEHGMTDTAVFEFFVRELPPERNFLMAAGLAQVVEFLQGLRFEADELDWMRGSGHFGGDFVDYLSEMRFPGDVDAMPEGTLFFADEPILRLVAPMPVAQLVESRIINLLHLQTLIASKAARMVLTAPRAKLVDFGLRRAHGAEAGLLAARAAYLAGFSATATVAAGQAFDIPISGTMAHSFIQAHDDEARAFENFAHTHPDNTVLLIDTYDTLRGAQIVTEVASRLAAEGIHVRGVRIDSGDLGECAQAVRRILDAGGCEEVAIFVSGNLDEYVLEETIRNGYPIDGYGIGTRLDVSADCPYLDCAYKLQEYAGQARRKRSEGKATWPGRKQVYRRYEPDGLIEGDILTLEGDDRAGQPLLRPIMRGGSLAGSLPSLAQSRKHAHRELSRLPERLRGLEPAEAPPVVVSGALRSLAEEVDARTGRK